MLVTGNISEAVGDHEWIDGELAVGRLVLL